ncbi:MAG: mechanosensitive ion channel family protein [Myxococcales bacterium]|nr:mechanosensitive ion channel family protein [Myxococcales bacterium]
MSRANEIFGAMTLTGGVGLAAAIALLLVLPLVLPKHERRRVRLPAVFLGLYVGIVALRVFGNFEEEAQKTLHVTGVFFLLASLARSVFLVGLHSVVTRYLGGAEVPRIVRDLIQALLYVGVAMLTLRAAGVEPGSLLTTSALLTAVIGLSLQDTLGNLFAGLAIQAQRPFRVGDWIMFDDRDQNAGRVVEMSWRAVKIITVDQVEIIVPNSMLAKSPLKNFSSPTPVARRHVHVEAPYGRPPEQVIRELVEAAKSVPGVLVEPPPSVIINEFTERGVRYDLRFFIDDFVNRDNVAGLLRERIWYAFQRAEIELTVPQRVVRMFDYTEERLEHEAAARVDERDEALRQVDFLRALPDGARHRLAEGATSRLYAPAEVIIEEGAQGEELFIIQRGEVRVEVGRSRREVARLGRGQFFGEMSLMTGEQRKASVRAVTEAELLVISRQALRPVLEAEPTLAETISTVLAERAASLDSKVSVTGHDAPGLGASDPASRELLTRIKRFFSLGGD